MGFSRSTLTKPVGKASTLKTTTRTLTRTAYRDMLIKFPVQLHEDVARVAEERGSSFSGTVREVLRQHIEDQAKRAQ
jgi:hypothetical protein